MSIFNNILAKKSLNKAIYIHNYISIIAQQIWMLMQPISYILHTINLRHSYSISHWRHVSYVRRQKGYV